jgi:hypothetical protein
MLCKLRKRRRFNMAKKKPGKSGGKPKPKKKTPAKPKTKKGG